MNELPPGDRGRDSVGLLDPRSVFREGALAGYQAARPMGTVLRLAPHWVRVVSWAMPVVLFAALLATLLPVTEYSEGPALVQGEDGVHVVARSAGTVETVMVHPREGVEAGQVLVRFSDDDERTDRQRLEREWELNLLALLRDPLDDDRRRALASLRAEKERADERLEDRDVRASVRGVIGDVWTRTGQYVRPGDRLVSVLPASSTLQVTVALPGYARPFLHPGLPLRFVLDGFRDEYQDLVVTSVGDEIIGPTEARRFLGHEQGEALSLQGPVTLVTSVLSSSTFAFEDRTFHYRPGLIGRAFVPLRRRRILQLLVPAFDDHRRSGG